MNPLQVDHIEPEMLRIVREKTPAEWLAIANGMWRSARDMLRNLLRAEHPDWSDDEVDAAVARRLADSPGNRDLSFLLGVWVHQSCFDRCKESGRPAGVPW